MTAITTAARLLRVAADELKNAHTLGGDWSNEHEALDAYNEHMATATTLEHMARQCLAQIEEPADDLAELAMLNKLIELGAKASYAHAKSNSDDGPAGTAAYVQWQELRAEMGELIRAHKARALEAPAAPAVPAGFALVPIEPTQQMLDAGRWSGAGSVSIQEEWARKEVWSRMLATVTPPPAAYADDLVALVTELVQALRKATPDNDLAGHALDYLKRNGLQESPLRAAEAAPQAPAAPAVDAETIKKAARYDWLRDFHNGPDGVQANLPHIAAGSDNDLVWALIGEDADAGIDAALAAQAKEGGEA